MIVNQDRTLIFQTQYELWNPSLISTYIFESDLFEWLWKTWIHFILRDKIGQFRKDCNNVYSKLQKCVWINHNIWYAGRDNRDRYTYRRIIISEIVWVFLFLLNMNIFCIKKNLFLLRTLSNRILYTLIKIYTIKNMLSPLLHERSGEVEATTSNIIWVIT